MDKQQSPFDDLWLNIARHVLAEVGPGQGYTREQNATDLMAGCLKADLEMLSPTVAEAVAHISLQTWGSIAAQWVARAQGGE